MAPGEDGSLAPQQSAPLTSPTIGSALAQPGLEPAASSHRRSPGGQSTPYRHGRCGRARRRSSRSPLGSSTLPAAAPVNAIVTSAVLVRRTIAHRIRDLMRIAALATMSDATGIQEWSCCSTIGRGAMDERTNSASTTAISTCCRRCPRSPSWSSFLSRRGRDARVDGAADLPALPANLGEHPRLGAAAGLRRHGAGRRQMGLRAVVRRPCLGHLAESGR